MNQPLHFILADFGPKFGRAWVERDLKDMDRATTIADIANGQWGGSVTVIQVIEVNLPSCASRDVTAEIMLAASMQRAEAA